MGEPLGGALPPSSPLRLQGIHSVNLNLSEAEQYLIPVSFQQVPSAGSSGGSPRYLSVPQRYIPDVNGVGLVAVTTGGSRAAAHPTLVTSLASPTRATQMITGASRSPILTNHVVRKRPRPQDLVLPSEPTKRRIVEYKLAKLYATRTSYAEGAAELFFLRAGGCAIDFPTWRLRRNNVSLKNFLESHRLDPSDMEEDLTVIIHNKEQDGPEPIAPVTPDPTPPPPTISSANDIGGHDAITRPGVHLSPYKSVAVPTSRPSHSITAYDSSMTNQDQIAERVKQEAYVAQRIAELQKEGLWAEKRLPKVQEPPRSKAHWDYLLEEMTWLSADFIQERKWKKANAKKCAKMVQKYFLDKESLQRKEEKSQEIRLRKIANYMAREVKNFWSNVNKLVEFKQTTRLEEKRKKALDQHLSFIVDQTEKYSTWLAESMNKSGVVSRPQSPTQSASTSAAHASDEEFQPNLSSSDDEETIAKEEDEREPDEIDRLQSEMDMPLDELLDSLPKDYFLNRDKDLSQIDSLSTKSEDVVVDDEGEDNVKESDRKQRQKEPVKDDDEAKINVDRDSDDDETASESEESSQSESEAESADSSREGDVSLKTLVDNQANKDVEGSQNDEADKEMNAVASIAESLQPKGSSYLTTNVVTAVPFLLKHCLREYQHIGLDWLVTMFDRKLNGILADEMGLGKTIQTIALLSHLACDRGNWGPHLIIVPTSVMLNWEMEIKKWCPAFKILTYYGTIKERKAKRSGWTKPNAFHICITSYKLVIQDNQSFRRKKWQYLVLDEAQNIKNFRSQRWQLLLNFHTARRLLLTGTPLQNNLMELWSLMHFLMPHVFQSHREFKEWFSNPVTGMLEGNSEYNDTIIKRLHKVLRPFLLRRLKTEVEKQLPKKYEHVVMCRLSKRQRYLYDDFMSRAKTKETLAAGNLLSVINVLMQLRKVCNHPNLFETRPVISPFQMEGIDYRTASLVTTALDHDPDRHVNFEFLNLRLIDMEPMTALSAIMTWRRKVERRLIEELDDMVVAEKPQPPKCVINLRVENLWSRHSAPTKPVPMSKNAVRLAGLPAVEVGRSPSIRLQDYPVPESPLRLSGSGVHLIPGMKQTRLPVHLVETSKGRHIYFPLQSAQPTESVNTVIANGQRMGLGNLKAASDPSQVTEGPESDVDVVGNKVFDVTVKRFSPIVPTRCSDPDEATSPLHPLALNAVEERRRARRQARLRSLAAVHERRCERFPLYGADTVERFRIVDQLPPSAHMNPAAIRWSGTASCHAIATARLRPHQALWTVSNALTSALRTPEQLAQSLEEQLSRFVGYVPAVNAPRPTLHVSHPPPSRLWHERLFEDQLVRSLAPRCRLLHPIARNMATQFPDPRLIQYDCGKLQVLDRLLRQLKTEHHKVLLFTQMTRMLDVLEAFLNYHGYIYLRLDGTTKVDQRQVLMERFNGDDRIFVFILSTRSGGIGVNLTGADTVIFYDSDWNPTMDAQAQDRCHRIGQTRDVHIYRLVSEMTVEENILKKANQKRLLGDLAIEGGNFTTAYFKSQSTIQDLFNVDMNETDANKRMRQTLGGEKRGTEQEPENSGMDKTNLGALESALATAEDATDVEAARTATAEAAAELAEFDETIPLEEAPETTAAAEPELSKAEMEVDQLVQQLKPIERYAMRYVEENEAAWSAEQLAAAEAQIEEQKREWELNRQAAMEAEEARLRDEEEEEDLTYTRTPNNEVKRKKRNKKSQSDNSSDDSSGSDTDTSSGDSTTDDEEVVSENDKKESEVAARVVKIRTKAPGPARKTRSRGAVNINLWTLDEDGVLKTPAKRKSLLEEAENEVRERSPTVKLIRVNGNASSRRESSDVDVENNDSDGGVVAPTPRPRSRRTSSVKPVSPHPTRLKST